MLNTHPIPLSLYVHTPWCIKKCPYCDFNSHPLRGDIPETDFLERLLEDLDRQLPLTGGRPLHSIFIGGGTPSLISPHIYEALFEGIQKRVAFSEGIEITLEANPGTVEQSRFLGYREAGINRLSIGVQSFDNDSLEALGRIHDADAAKTAVQSAQIAGFERINIDLMHGLPKQTPAMAVTDLETALSLGVSHLSWYQLTLEPNTYFHRYPPALPEDEALWDIQCTGEALLKQAGFEHYEISAFAQPGQACQHNLNYWRYGDYLGIGPGAHGKVTLADDVILRLDQVKHPKMYLGEPFPEANRFEVPKARRVSELLMNVLRLNTPYDFEMASARTGISEGEWRQKLGDVAEFLDVTAKTFQTNDKGRRYLNHVLEQFV